MVFLKPKLPEEDQDHHQSSIDASDQADSENIISSASLIPLLLFSSMNAFFSS